MTNFDLDSLNLDELKKLQKDVAKTISNYEARKFKEAKAKVTAAAQELGYTLEELVGSKSTSLKTTAVPKYRHPDNPEQTWSGRGRQPAWFREAVAAGASPDDLAIS